MSLGNSSISPSGFSGAGRGLSYDYLAHDTLAFPFPRIESTMAGMIEYTMNINNLYSQFT
ncbi:MAG: hypothetical protein Q8O09_01015 [Bacillota bacterium]|nr:hypothetical protein [Bacillota bacterium]